MAYTEDLLKCNKCDLRKDAQRVVPPEGKVEARIMIVGRNPGIQEDEIGCPFVGPGGKFLDKMLERLSIYKREDVYITNMCKCFSANNRPPTNEEIEICSGWLLKEIRIVRPLIIIPLGNQAAILFLGGKYGRVIPYHSKFFYHKGTNSFVIPLYHPGYSVRNPRAAEECLVDMDILKSRIPLLFSFIKEHASQKKMFTNHKEFITKFEPYVVEKETSG